MSIESSGIINEKRLIDKKSVTFILGSTQSGKSSLINFLHDPSGLKNPCVIGNGLNPTTINPDYYHVEYETKEIEKRSLRDIEIKTIYQIQLIDTPGLEDKKDDENMIRIYQKMNGSIDIGIPVLVHMFGKPFTESYHNILKDYKKMIPGLFDKGFILVVTNLSMTERNIQKLQRQKIDINKWEQDFILNLNQSFNIQQRPTVIYIDSYPISNDEMECSITSREFILSKIINTPTMKITSTLFLKPKSWRLVDQTWIAQCETLLEGYREGIAQRNNQIKGFEQEQKKLMSRLSSKKEELEKYETELKIKDVDSKMQVATWNSTKAWRIFTQEDIWNLHSDKPITQRQRIKHNNCSMKVTREDEHFDSGIVSGILRGTYADVTIYTDKKLFYQRDIISAKELVSHLKPEVEEMQNRLSSLTDSNEVTARDLKSILKKFNQTQKLRDQISAEFSPLNEMIQRYNKIKSNLWTLDLMLSDINVD